VTPTLGLRQGQRHRLSLDAQRAALTAAEVDPARVFTEERSGSVKSAGSGLTAMLDYARHGDIVVVSAIDCLGRSIAEVTRTIADLGERGITLRALREGIDTATRPGGAVAAIIATLAELELGCERRAASRQAPSSREHSEQAKAPPAR
jgi:DNA invertase Pin-like site-specific DNA recombinase